MWYTFLVKKYLRNFPIETYVILLPAVIFLLIMCVYVFFRESGYISYFFHGHFLSSVLFIDSIFSVPFVIFMSSIIAASFMWKNNVDSSHIFIFMRSSLFMFCVLYFGLLALSVLAQLVFNIADPVRTAASSVMFTNWDYAIFGTYPWLSLHSFITANWLQKFIFESYLYTTYIMVVLFAVVALKNVFLFRKFLLAYFIVIAMGVPFWIVYPALAPDIMYRSNILNVPVKSDLEEKLDNTNFSENSKKALSFLEKFWIDQSKDSLPITSFPSMHSAWGIIVTVIGIELWAPLAFVLVPWVLAELIGTLLTLQHYAVDTIFGVILGFIALIIAHRLLDFEKRKNFNKLDLFLALNKLQTKFEKIVSFLRNKSENFPFS